MTTTFKGIIFDFNGTLLLDSDLHEITWIKMAAKLRQKPLTIEEFQLNGHGRTNKTIISYLLGRIPDKVELDQIVEEKESTYRQMCLNQPEVFKLAPGVIPFLNLVKDKNIVRTIATGSYKGNVDFYFEHLDLAKWFNRELVVLDDGTMPGKPEPHIFKAAAKKIGLYPSDCLVFEDSYSGITSAHHAGIGHIVVVEPLTLKEKITVPTQNISFTNGFTDEKINRISLNL